MYFSKSKSFQNVFLPLCVATTNFKIDYFHPCVANEYITTWAVGHSTLGKQCSWLQVMTLNPPMTFDLRFSKILPTALLEHVYLDANLEDVALSLRC